MYLQDRGGGGNCLAERCNRDDGIHVKTKDAKVMCSKNGVHDHDIQWLRVGTGK